MLKNDQREPLKNPVSNIFSLENSNLNTIKKQLPHRYQLCDEPFFGHTWQCLDTFDNELSNAKKLLLRHGTTLILYQVDQGIFVQEQCPKSWSFVAELAEGVVQRQLDVVSELRACLPVTEVEATLHRCRILDDEGKTVCRLQWLQIEQPSGSSLSVVQLQEVRGYVKALNTIRSLFEPSPRNGEKGRRQAVNTCLAAGLEAEQIIQRLCPERTNYTAKPVMKIDPQAPAAEIKKDLVGVYLNNARLNEEGVIADWDTEFLHEYRVSLRKVRSVLSLFKGVFEEAETEALKQQLANLMRGTNRLRDLDVYLLDQADYMNLVPEALQPGLEKMFADFGQERRQQLGLVRKQLSSASYRDTMQQLQQQFPENSDDEVPQKTTPLGPQAVAPVGDYASALIYKRYRKIRKLARTIDDYTPDEEVHELRIHFKKLRYLMEFFASLYPAAELKKLLKAMKRLQTCLGRFNDFSVQQMSLREVVESPPSGREKPEMDVVLSIGALVAAIHQKQVAARHEIVQNLDVFSNDLTSDLFERLFHRTPVHHKPNQQMTTDLPLKGQGAAL